MNIKRFLLAGCSVVVLSAGTALAGPCDTTGRTANSKDAGSGPASQSTSQTVGTGNDSKEHPPTSTMNRASGDVAASSQDSQRQMQGNRPPRNRPKAPSLVPRWVLRKRRGRRTLSPPMRCSQKALMSRPPIRAAEYVKRRTVSRLGRRVGGSATVRLRAIASRRLHQR